MPVYEATDPLTGKTLEIEGASPPTEEELEQLFANQFPSIGPANEENFIPDKPLTPEDVQTERGVSGGSAFEAIFPPALATAGAVFAPQTRFPQLAGVAGQAISGLARNLPKIGAAGVGGGAGEASVEAARGGDLEDVAIAGAEGAKDFVLAETAGLGAGAVLEKTLRPFAGKITEQSKKLLEFAKEKNIPASIDAFIPGMTQKLLKGGTDNFLPSRLANDVFRRKAVKRMNNIMQEAIDEVGPVADKETVDILVTEGFQSAVKSKRATAINLANNFVNDIGAETVIKLNKTAPLFKKISKNAKNQELLNFIEAEKGLINKGSKTAEGLELTLRQLSGSLKRVKGRDQKFIGEIRKAIKEDFKSAGANMEKLKKSDQFFSQHAGMLQGSTARRLEKGSVSPDALTAQIFKRENRALIKSLQSELDPNTWQMLKARNLANVIDSATAETSMMGVKAITKPDSILRQIRNNRDLYQEIYGKETVKALENLGNLAKASADDIKKIKDGVLSNLGFSPLALTGAFGALVTNDPTTLTLGAAGSIPLAISMMRPNGLMKRYLTTGVQSGLAPAKEAIKLGIRVSATE